MAPVAAAELDAKLDSLPTSPGCYVFRDGKRAVLYVGKAKSLRARVKSYFQASSGDTRAFVPVLLGVVQDFETIVTVTEKEAAILENSLIKELKPRFNVKLRDDKEFLTLRLSSSHAWPRLDLVRRPVDDGARYFGPYHSATAARRTLHLVEKHFQLRTCSDAELERRRRPCLQYQIKRCPAPCVLPVDSDVYAHQVRAVGLFLDGRHDELTRDLESSMNEASGRMDYELAATYRDQLAAVESARAEQRVVVATRADQDVLGLHREADLIELAVLTVRAGRVVDATTFSTKKLELPDDEVVAAFLRERYADASGGTELVPDEILVPVLPEGAAGVAEWLTDLRQSRGGAARKVQVLRPVRGPRKRLHDLAMENARHAFLEKRRAANDLDERLARLQNKLRLPTVPRRIECCDISHLGGGDTVGAVVAVTDGAADRKRYRTFHVRGVAEGDDYAAMYQVLSRRFRRGRRVEAGDGEPTDQDARAAEWDLPDLFVVDGGRGQLGVALTAARDLGLHDLKVVGLAKERDLTSEHVTDRIYLPGQKNPIILRSNSPELFLLALARDEAHRFANVGRERLGNKRRLTSELDAVRGIGAKTRKALLTALGSAKAVRDATDEALLAVPGVTRRQVASLREHFASPPDAEPPPASQPRPDAPAD